MKLKLFSQLILMGAGIATSAVAVSPIQADPSDDYSFEISDPSVRPSQRRKLWLKSEHAIQAVFKSRLSLGWKPLSRQESTRPVLAGQPLYAKGEGLDGFSRRLAHHLMKLCQEHRFDPAFVLALIEVESTFRLDAGSHAGARGLMQLMPATAQHVAHSLKLGKLSAAQFNDPFMNLTLGVTYLSWLRDRYRHTSPYFMVAAYNLGPARLDQLVARKGFKPLATKKYFELIRRGIFHYRFVRGSRV